MPLMLLGGINERATIEKAMELGFDYVAMGRALIFEPGLVNRLAGEVGGAVGCIHCNRCMPSTYAIGGTHSPGLAGRCSSPRKRGSHGVPLPGRTAPRLPPIPPQP